MERDRTRVRRRRKGEREKGGFGENLFGKPALRDARSFRLPSVLLSSSFFFFFLLSTSLSFFPFAFFTGRPSSSPLSFSSSLRSPDDDSELKKLSKKKLSKLQPQLPHRLLRHTANTGPAAARNTGLDAAAAAGASLVAVTDAAITIIIIAIVVIIPL